MNSLVPLSGGYELIRMIGAGAFGEVWRAEAPGGVEVAIKIIPHSVEQEGWQRELQALELVKRLRHPFLLQTQAYWLHDGRLHIVMDLAEGSLRQRLLECHEADKAGLPPGELLVYIREAAEALDFLHEQCVQHRDVKPDNLLLLQGHAQVADFGLACAQQGGRTPSAICCGTPGYMAPEVWLGQLSPHSDQYSLAVTYAELRLGPSYFPSRGLLEVMLDRLMRTSDMTLLTEAERHVLARALAKQPDQRYPSCSTFVHALERVLPDGYVRPGDSLHPAAGHGSSSPPPTEPRDKLATPVRANARLSAPTSRRGAYCTIASVRQTASSQPEQPGNCGSRAEDAPLTERSVPRRWIVRVALVGLLIGLLGLQGWYLLGASLITLRVNVTVEERQ
jgi:serine/threonine protein kinase